MNHGIQEPASFPGQNWVMPCPWGEPQWEHVILRISRWIKHDKTPGGFWHFLPGTVLASVWVLSSKSDVSVLGCRRWLMALLGSELLATL